MNIIDSFFLGLVQGLTEFLPISSSGHLVLAETLLHQKVSQGITFEVVVHFGTLCSILIYYREELQSILKSLLELILEPKDFGNKVRKDDNVKLSGFIIISMIPAMIIGLTMEHYIENIFANPALVSIMLIVTGCLLFFTKFIHRFEQSVDAPKSFYIGLAQAFAIIPGISRSGSTISLGLYMNMKRKEVANFSFLMVIPVIGGAMLLKMLEIWKIGLSPDMTISLIVGFLTSFVSGYFALKYLIILLRNKGIHYFAYYCWVLGIVGFLYFQFG